MDKVKPIGETISIDGGLSSNIYFKEFLATLIQKRIISPTNREITAQGVALLARKGLGLNYPMKVRNQNTITEPGKRDLSPYFEKYKDIISRSRNLRGE